ncbi:MAG: pyrrolo-quinoline quinone [Betaproteobacteria bacterium]|nr:pyrrolo-quinoline quinone [Betaproteobacteria bacterium]
MKKATIVPSGARALVFGAALVASLASAQLADIANVPLANSPSDAVKPNLMYVLDDSGSMNWTYMPDQIQRLTTGQIIKSCNRCPTPHTLQSVNTSSELLESDSNIRGNVGAEVRFLYGSIPAPLSLNTTYYIRTRPSGTTFTLASTSGGAANINLTSNNDGAYFTVSLSTLSVDDGTNERITASSGHGATVGSTVRFTSGIPPSPLVLNTTYYVVEIGGSPATTFSLATTPGGSKINLTQPTGIISAVNTTTETLTFSSAHGAVVGSYFQRTSGSNFPGGMNNSTTYYVVAVPSATTVQVSTTPGGSVVNLSTTTTGAAVRFTHPSAFVVDGGCSGPGGEGSLGQACGNYQADPNDPASADVTPTYGEAGYYSAQFNQIYYNPNISYTPAVNYAGVSYGDMNPSAARRDYYLDASTVNLVNQLTELFYCKTDSPSAAELFDTAVCRRNGIHNVAPFTGFGTPDYFIYWNAVGAPNQGYPTTEFPFRVRSDVRGPHYFAISPHEYCNDKQLRDCALANAAGGAVPGFSIPATVRWCKTAADAQSPLAVTGNSGSPATARCQEKFIRSTYQFARYGRFRRVDITPSVASYPKSASAIRPDCAGATCSYAQELQNFANWYSYYRNRMMLMKTATGRAFLSIDNRYRIGFITINPNNPVTSSKFLKVAPFESAAGGHKEQWYNKLYAQNTNGSTPLREALSRVGRYYAGQITGINAGMRASASVDDPVQYSCQQNFALLTTDGYWNGNSGQTESGGGIGNQDNVNSGFTTRSSGAFDGGLAGSNDTLADVAAYYYKTDLRTSPANLAENNVPTSPTNTATHQHMVTFTLGLGLKGLMDYIPDYQTNPVGDFANIRSGASGACSWTTGTCNWPEPVAGAATTLDDLWHAAVNGRGQYFSAGDPNSLAQGLQSALAALNVQTAAASASATSSPNVTETDNFIYSSTFRTVKWDGEIIAQRISTTTGEVLPTVEWTAQSQLNGRTTDTSDTRTIYTIAEGMSGKRKPFAFTDLTSAPVGSIAAERTYFANKCGSLSQCALLTLTQQADANNGENLVNYLRGQRKFEKFTDPETNAVFRTREAILGDPVNATPAFVSAPRFSFSDAVTPTYEQFKTTYANRTPVLYIAANDGMLHALNGNTGSELWAYVPRIVMPKMHRLATANWGVTHEFLVDGSPRTMDVFIGGSWRTILVAGLNSGGRGYYALDVTEPTSPQVLWEFCHTNTLCQNWDADMGLSFGNPVITKRPSDGKWVVLVTSGLNNVAPGDGKGYLYVLDALTGVVLSKVGTGIGSIASPSGLNKIAAFVDNFANDNTAKYVYGGDLYGNVWKVDLTSGAPSATRLARLQDAGSKPQPITAVPELAEINGFPVVYVGTGLYYGTADLFDPASLIPPYPWAYRQSMYAIKDRGVDLGVFRAANVVQNFIVDSGGITRQTTNNDVDWSVKDGWFVDFNPGNTSPGERVNIDPQLVQGTLVVVTNVPNNSACTVGGDSWFYTFDYLTGRMAPAATVAGTKQTGKITVGVVVVRLPSGVLRAIITTAEGSKATVPVPTGGGAGKVRRVGWRELLNDRQQ